MESDRVYYTRRAAEERAAALKAEHPKARAVHLAMAAAYDDRLAAAAEPEPGIHLVA